MTEQRLCDCFHEKALPALEKVDIPPSTMLAPVPVVMVTTGAAGYDNRRANIVTVAWTGTVNSEPPMLSVSLKPCRHSHQAVVQTGEFVVNLVPRELAAVCDYCGVTSGRDTDKFADCGLTAEAMPGMDSAPAIAQSPVNLACKVRQTLELGSHTMFVAEVVGIRVANDLIDPHGAIQLDRAGLVAYVHGCYHGLSEALGFFGYAVARPEVRQKRMAEVVGGERSAPKRARNKMTATTTKSKTTAKTRIYPTSETETKTKTRPKSMTKVRCKVSSSRGTSPSKAGPSCGSLPHKSRGRATRPGKAGSDRPKGIGKNQSSDRTGKRPARRVGGRRGPHPSST